MDAVVEKQRAEALIPRFELERILNQDQAGRRISLLGKIDGQPALLSVERAPFSLDEGWLSSLPRRFAKVQNLGVNDVYSWTLAVFTGQDELQQDTSRDEKQEAAQDDKDDFFADVKLNLIFPCTPAHVAKYSKQAVRLVVESPQTYHDAVRPYMQRKRQHGQLNWVYNIIDGKTEVEDVIYRTPRGQSGDEGFLLAPDLNWDRSTLEALHLLALVERRDMWSLRDIKKKHIAWLEHMRSKLVAATVATYPSIQPDQLKLYVHYQPTYYHFHIHIVHVALEAGATQATGKAVGLDSIIETLRVMAGNDETGMDTLTMSYTLGEASELWTHVFAPLKATLQSRQ
ncbi:hypothetical protein CDD82_5411 [Ophiocordyceps australis]|uniref:Scavenger mRNA-decapping enzyme DcpS n=1 Tax=Ophiocordyceps australis TaxID=1399860 RepID=A0A2C5ZUZ1_9HYPO|nr:hypothetical protein CDD82_5411 [Ophiocordyceps australis]